MISECDTFVSATDGFALAATLFESRNVIRSGVVINAGAGIRMRHYRHFAKYLATLGHAALIYDYRGIGASRPRHLRGFRASVEDWGSKDCAGVLEWLHRRYPGLDIAVVGHSVGGLLIGLGASGVTVSKVVLVGPHTGFYGDSRMRDQLWMLPTWHALMPLLTKAFKYFPGQRLGILEDLPAQVALDWARRAHPSPFWHLSKGTAPDDLGRLRRALEGFSGIRAHGFALRFSDDAFSTAAASARVESLFSSCEFSHLTFHPRDIGRYRAGHLGYFRRYSRNPVWTSIAEFLFAR